MQTVAELVEYLQTLPQDSVVIFSKDSEGNDYSPWCGDHSDGFYVPEGAWRGDFHGQPGEGPGWGKEDWEIYNDAAAEGTAAICLWPVN